jgi:Htaa
MEALVSKSRSRLALVGAALLAVCALALMAAAPAGAAKVKFAGGETSLALDPGAAALLTGAGIAPAPVDPATAKADGSLAFPITGGRVDDETLGGKIKHSGGIRLSSSSATVELTDFVINTKKSELTATVGGSRVAILALDLENAKVKVNGKRGTVKVSGVDATLTKAAADALNAAFSTTAFSEGAKLGVATVKAKL